MPDVRLSGRVHSAVMVASLLATGLSAQTRPDFSGVWAAAAAGPAARAASLGSGWGRAFILDQDAAHLTIERTFFTRGDLQPPLRLAFALDGTASHNRVMMGRGIQETVSTSAWAGDTLVITTVHTVDTADGPIPSEVTRRLWLEPPPLPAWAPQLVIETTRGGVLGGPPSTTRTVYTRS